MIYGSLAHRQISSGSFHPNFGGVVLVGCRSSTYYNKRNHFRSNIYSDYHWVPLWHSKPVNPKMSVEPSFFMKRNTVLWGMVPP